MPEGESRSSVGAMPGFPEWRMLVAKTLTGRDPATLRSRTRDGILIEPLYERRRDAPAFQDRGAARWTIVQIVDDSDPDRANEQALADLAGGATGLALRFADAPSASGHGLPPTSAALAAALEGIDLAAIHIRIEPHAAALQSALWLKAQIETSGIAPERADVAFGLDPASVSVSDAELESDLFAKRVTELRAGHFRGPFAQLDARLYHEAGASEAQELGALLGAAAWWLHALEGAGVPPAEAMALFGASVAVDRDLFLSIARLRAVRLLWARLSELCGVRNIRLPIHAETSRRMLTRADPPTNLLRNTLAAFAAAVGGADSIAIAPHSAALGLADRNARALARNIQHLLLEESHLHTVADPGAGSGAIETLTDALAEQAWAEFQAIERKGGIIESLRGGMLQARISEARAGLVEEVANGSAPLIGATVHHSASEPPPLEAPTAVAGAMHGLAPISLEALALAAA